MCGGALGGQEASQDLVCDHLRGGMARGSVRGSPQEKELISEPAGVSSEQCGSDRK